MTVYKPQNVPRKLIQFASTNGKNSIPGNASRPVRTSYAATKPQRVNLIEKNAPLTKKDEEERQPLRDPRSTIKSQQNVNRKQNQLYKSIWQPNFDSSIQDQTWNLFTKTSRNMPDNSSIDLTNTQKQESQRYHLSRLSKFIQNNGQQTKIDPNNEYFGKQFTKLNKIRNRQAKFNSQEFQKQRTEFNQKLQEYKNDRKSSYIQDNNSNYGKYLSRNGFESQQGTWTKESFNKSQLKERHENLIEFQDQKTLIVDFTDDFQKIKNSTITGLVASHDYCHSNEDTFNYSLKDYFYKSLENYSDTKNNRNFMQKRSLRSKKKDGKNQTNFIEKNKSLSFQGSKNYSQTEVVNIKKMKRDIYQTLDEKQTIEEKQQIDVIDEFAEIEIQTPRLDEKILNKIELKSYWAKELDHQIRNAGFVDFEQYFKEQEARKQMLQEKQAKLKGISNEQSLLKQQLQKNSNTIQAQQNLRNKRIENMNDQKRAEYEKKLRQEMRNAIEDFLSKKNIEEAIALYKDELRIENFSGYSPKLKRDVLVAKMIHKFQEVGDKLINSYWWEGQRKVKEPQNPNMFRQLIKNILEINEGQLIQKFIKNIDKMQKIDYKKHAAPRLFNQQYETPQNDDYFEIEVQNPSPYEKKQQPSQEQRMKESMRKVANKDFLKKFQDYHDDLMNQYFQVEEEIREDNFHKQELQDPTIAKDLDAVIEDNLEKVMANSDIYKDVKTASKQKNELQVVKQNANQMTDFLKGQAAQKKAQFLKDSKRLADASLIQMLFGTNRDSLVLKFINKLKAAVQKRRDEEAKIQKENFIKSVLLKMEFNNTIKYQNEDMQNQDNLIIKQQLDRINQQLQNVLKENIEVKESVLQIQKLVRRELTSQPWAYQNQFKKDLEDIMLTQSVSIKKQEILFKLQRKIVQLFQNYNALDKREESESESSYYEPSDTDSEKERQMKDDKEEQRKYRLSEEAKKAMSTYIRKSLDEGQAPLPILNRCIDGYLGIINYQINETNAESLAEASLELIPKNIRKLYLVQNSIKDNSLAYILRYISESIGLQGFGIIGNSFGPETMEALAQYTLQGNAFRMLKKFIMKEPNPYRPCSYATGVMINEITLNAFKFKSLKKIVLAGLGFDVRCAVNIAQAASVLTNLKQLDISGNGLNGNGLRMFLSNFENAGLMSLNIGYNSTFIKELAYAKDSFEYLLSKFIRKQKELVHLDLSGLAMKFSQLCYIVRRGIRRSRSLVSVHLDGMNLNKDQIVVLRKQFNTLQVFRHQKEELDDNIDRVLLGTTNTLIVSEVFFFEEDKERMDYMKKQNDRTLTHLKNQIQQKINSSIFRVLAHERLSFQRILGHPEMPLGHRWVQRYSHLCQVCNKHTYTIFVWNKKLAAKTYAEQNNQQKKRDKGDDIETQFYKHINLETIENIFPGQINPLLQVQGQPIQEMITVSEFIQRMSKLGQNNVRPCNNEIEEVWKNKLEEIVNKNQYDKAQIWKSKQELDPNYQPLSADELLNWVKIVKKLIPQDPFQPINLKQYQKRIEQAYSSEDLLNGISDETFLCGMYLPRGNIDFVVKTTKIQGVFYMRTVMIPKKHLSINKIPANQKMVKKVKEIRYFSLDTSVFKGFKFETEELIEKSLRFDWNLMKMKFVKDKDDQDKIFQIFKKYFIQIRNQFLTKISNPKTYPAIEWLSYVNTCQKWGIIDKNLTSTDVDRLFIATNFEEVSNEQNDEKSLCRYEFFEIIVRMANQKFFENNICSSVSQSVEKILKDFILPNSIEEMDLQPFRDKYLWTLDVDEILRINTQGIEKLYFMASTNKAGNKKFFSKNDAIELAKMAMLPISDHKNILAYILSKYTFENEMGEFEKYNQMLLSEFYEYIGRLAQLQYPENIPLSKKIERILGYFMPLIGLEANLPIADEDIESESDYDDDQVDMANQKLLKQFKIQEQDSQEEDKIIIE